MVKLLVVDDDKDQVALFTQLLARSDYRVVSATSVVDALGILKKEHDVDVVLTDFRMPTIDGSGFLERMRLEYPHIPVIVMSVDYSNHASQEMLNRGAASYLRKPFSRQQLIETIQQVTARALAEREAAQTLLDTLEEDTAQALLDALPDDPEAQKWAEWIRRVAELEEQAQKQMDMIGVEIERAYRRGFTEALMTLLKLYEATGEITIRELQRIAWTHDLWQREIGPSKLKLEDNSHPTTVFPPLYKELIRLRKYPKKTY